MARTERQTGVIGNEASFEGRRSKRTIRLVMIHAHDCAALLLAALVLFDAGARVGDHDLASLSGGMLIGAGGLAMAGALVPLVSVRASVRFQRWVIWGALALAAVPSSLLIADVGLTGLVGCNLLLIGAVLAEQTKRPRVLPWLWIAIVFSFVLTLLHLMRPFV
jgi:hypothetical protein